jgi:mitochondrial fission protein ELM1
MFARSKARLLRKFATECQRSRSDMPIDVARTDNWTAWALTTGELGMRHQAVGLARAAGAEVTEKIVHLARWARWLPAGASSLLTGLDCGADGLRPPWPDLVISCGRRGAAAALALRKKTGAGTAFVHVQDPQTSATKFDLVVAMPHDKVSGCNVIKLRTAVHHLDSAAFSAARREWTHRFADLAEPYLGVLVGGSTSRRLLSIEAARELCARLNRASATMGGSVLVATSPRTPSAVRHELMAFAKAHPQFWVWSGEGENPFVGILALAKLLVVTADSVSMVSEALATTAAVEIFQVPVGRRHAQFISRLFADGLVAPFTGDVRQIRPRVPFNTTETAAAAVRRLLELNRMRAILAGTPRFPSAA